MKKGILFSSILFALFGCFWGALNLADSSKTAAVSPVLETALTVETASNTSYSIEVGGNSVDIIYSARTVNSPIGSDGAGFSAEISGNKLMSVSQTGIATYRLLHFEIFKSGSYQKLEIPQDGLTIDGSYLEIQGGNSVISIRGLYYLVAEISVVIPSDSQGMGTFAVYYKDVDTYDTSLLTQAFPEDPAKPNLFVFDASTTAIIIEATPARYHEFIGFRPPHDSEQIKIDGVVVPNKIEVPIRVTRNRGFSLSFSKTPFTLQDTVASDHPVEIRHTDLQLSGEIFVTLKLPALYQVKDFKVNGIAVNHSDYTGPVVYNGNTATITLDSIWIKGNSDEDSRILYLDIEVTTKINDMILILIISGCVVIPLLTALMLYVGISGKRQKKATKAVLKTKYVQAYRTDTSKFIEDLKQGNISGITDKDVKSELKKQKSDQENKD